MTFPADQYAWDIRNRGRQVTLIKEANAPLDAGAPWDGSTAASTETSQTLTMKFKPIRLQDIDGNRVLESDQIVQILGADVTGAAPSVGDQINDGGAVLTVKGVTTKKQGATVYRYDLHVGR